MRDFDLTLNVRAPATETPLQFVHDEILMHNDEMSVVAAAKGIRHTHTHTYITSA